MITYFLKFILCSFVLLIFYRLFLEKEKMHHFNRFYLLASVLFSLAIPLVSIELKNTDPIAYEDVATLGRLNVYPATNPELPATILTQTDSNTLNSDYILPGIYAGVTLLLLLRFFLSFKVLLDKKNGKTLVGYCQSKLVLLSEEVTTFSFLNYIFVNEQQFRAGQIKAEILTHELAHVQQKHTLDLLFIELCRTIFWINPALFFYKKAITLNHEFLADGAVLSRFSDILNYQLLLLNKVLNTRLIHLTSNFNYSFTKKRLEMMKTVANSNRQKFMKFGVFVFLVAAGYIFCSKTYSQTDIRQNDSKVPTSTTGIKSQNNTTSLELSEQELAEYSNAINKYFVIKRESKGMTFYKQPG